MPYSGRRSGLRPGSKTGVRTLAPIVRASTSVGDVGHLVVAERHRACSTLCARRVGQRVVGHVLRVAVRLAAVPEHLHESRASAGARARSG